MKKTVFAVFLAVVMAVTGALYLSPAYAGETDQYPAEIKITEKNPGESNAYLDIKITSPYKKFLLSVDANGKNVLKNKAYSFARPKLAEKKSETGKHIKYNNISPDTKYLIRLTVNSKTISSEYSTKTVTASIVTAEAVQQEADLTLPDDSDEYIIHKGDSFSVKPVKATSPVSYESSDKSVATVSSNGKVKAKKNADVTITIKTKETPYNKGGERQIKLRIVSKNPKTAKSGRYAYIAEASSSGSQAVKHKHWYYSSSRDWSNWQVVIRCKDSDKAQIIAREALKGASKPNIRYSTSEKGYTLPQALSNCGWDMNNVNETVYTSCTPYAMACVMCAGIGRNGGGGKVFYKWGYSSTKTIADRLCATGQFVVITDKTIRTTGKGLKAGDILIGKKHGLIVTEVD